jgi:Zinc carboxypeptidase
MRRSLALLIAAVVGFALMVPAGGAAERNRDQLDAYTAVVNARQLSQLAEQGFDVHGERTRGSNFEVDLVLTAQQRARLAEDGINARLTRVRGGQTVRQFAASQAQDGFEVWRSWDEPGGYRDQMHEIAEDNPDIAELVNLGTTVQGREVLAVKLSARRPNNPNAEKSAVLYSSTQHAREWIANEVNRRLMYWFVDEFRDKNKEVRKVLRRSELWFVLVANPDGYEYTFDEDRLWRKNLRENTGDDEITIADGVDLNRNFPNHWNYDEEGSSSIISSETYRGPAPVSEPETAALKGLLDSVDFSFQVNWHSNGQWLLYADGWQVGTPTADDPIYYALSGNLDEPAIEDFHPGLSSDVLYVTNGETTDYAHAVTGALAWTPELSEGCPGCGFVFPDDEELVQEEFERNLPFALSVAKSADNPANPDSVLGIKTKPFYIESDDPYKEGVPGANFSFEYSYGDEQPVHVLAKRSLGKVTLKYRINGKRIAETGSTEEWEGGERYAPTSVHYREMRGVVEGTEEGDTVEVWFRGGGRRSESFTYEVVSDTDNEVLVVAAEDYTGASPGPTPGGPHYLDYYLDALEANGIEADVYDVDARGRTAPDHLGVLSHYDAVVWYTGDDVVTRRAGWGAGNADRLAMDEILEFRAYMNEGGDVLYTGPWAGMQYTGAAVGTQFYDPKGEGPCNPNPGFDPRRCLALRGSGDATNDVLQYYFGGYLQVAGDGHNPDTGDQFDATGTDDPLEGLSWGFNGADSAANQNQSSSFIATSGILPPDEYPQFESWPSSRYDKPGGPFEPHTGEHYVYSQIADVSYKRLTREIAVPAAGGELSFWTSYDTEAAWDHLFVEARTAGGNDWTTLPDENGHTTQAPGDSCTAGWRELHPQLDFYQTLNADGTCSPTGTGGGEWHAASGNSGGWQEWTVDLSEWSGETVEISIAYASDWAIQNLGVFVDDVTLPDGTSTSFETDLSGWQVSGAPEGSATNANDWIRTDAAGFPVGASITTPNSLLMGFGIEGITGADARAEVIGRAMDHLLD